MKEKTIVVNEHEISVGFVSPGLWDKGGYGRNHTIEQRIEINRDMPIDMQQSTMLHELLHFISDLGSLDPSESDIDCVALGMLSFIRNNHDMVKWIMNREETI